MDKEGLKLIPKYMEYTKYMFKVLDKIPRIDKFNLGSNFRDSMFKTIEAIMHIGKVGKEFRLEYINRVDALIATQRQYLRLMLNINIITDKQFNYAIAQLGEMGKMVGGLVKACRIL